MYKSKYEKYKKKYLTAKITQYGGVIIDETILGMGTDKLGKVWLEKNGFTIEHGEDLLRTAFDTGYVIIDTAGGYKNLDIISKIIKEKNNRNDIFIIYKMSTNGFNNLDYNINDVCKQIEYIDCFMYHEYDATNMQRYSSNPIDFDNDINILKKYISSGLIRNIGISNVLENVIYLDIDIKRFRDKDIELKYIENKKDIYSINAESIKYLNRIKELGMKYIGYGVLGGSGIETAAFCGSTSEKSTVDVLTEYKVAIDHVTFPVLNEVANRIGTDKMMTMMAFLSKKYGVIQIPSSYRVGRIISNFNNFRQSYEMLTNEDMDRIEQDILTSNDNFIYFELDNTFGIVQSFQFRNIYPSKKRVFDYFMGNSSFVDILQFINRYDVSELKNVVKQFVYSMIYMYELCTNILDNSYINKLLHNFSSYLPLIYNIVVNEYILYPYQYKYIIHYTYINYILYTINVIIKPECKDLVMKFNECLTFTNKTYLDILLNICDHMHNPIIKPHKYNYGIISVDNKNTTFINFEEQVPIIITDTIEVKNKIIDSNACFIRYNDNNLNIYINENGKYYYPKDIKDDMFIVISKMDNDDYHNLCNFVDYLNNNKFYHNISNEFKFWMSNELEFYM